MSGEIRKVLMKVEGFLLTTTDAVLRRQRVFSYGWIVMTDSHDILRGRASQHPRESVASVSSVCPVWDFLFPLASRVHISAGGDQLCSHLVIPSQWSRALNSCRDGRACLSHLSTFLLDSDLRQWGNQSVSLAVSLSPADCIVFRTSSGLNYQVSGISCFIFLRRHSGRLWGYK